MNIIITKKIKKYIRRQMFEKILRDLIIIFIKKRKKSVLTSKNEKQFMRITINPFQIEFILSFLLYKRF